jgi:hypothetical protein
MRYLDNMEKTVLQRIDSLHGARECHGAIGRVRCAIKLLLLYATFGIHRAYILLAKSPSHSFSQLHSPDEKGRWNVSYTDHLRFRVRMRVYALGTVVSLVASVALTISVIQLNGDSTTTYALTIVETMPTEEELEFDETPEPVEPAAQESQEEDVSPTFSSQSAQPTPFFATNSFSSAATNTISVTTTNALGAGSLAESLNTANASAATDLNRIQFTVAGTYTLPAEQVAVRRVAFSNTSGGRVVIDGSGLAASDSCLNFGSGANNSTVAGVQLINCPTGITVSDADDVTIENISITGGVTGIAVDTNSDDTVIGSVTIGQNDLGAAGALSGDGIALKGNGGEISNSVIGNTENAVSVSAQNVEVTKNYLGTSKNGDDLGNTSNGVVVSGSATDTIIGPSNVIANNAEYGVEIKDTSNTRITITQNDYSDNTLGNIEITDGANGNVRSPKVSTATSAVVTGTRAESGSAIEVYADGAYVAKTTSIASDGSWSVDVSGAYGVGADVTALHTDSAGNTSVFSNAVVASSAGDAFTVETAVEASQNTATLTISNQEKASVTLRYGTGANELNTTLTRSSLKKTHTLELEELRANTTYYYRVIAENGSGETVKTSTLSFTTGSNTPVLTSLRGDFSVVTQPESLTFEGSVNGATKSYFRFEDPSSGETIAACETQDHVCTLPFTLDIGEYDVFFDSTTQESITTESSDVHRLVVSPPFVTGVLTADARSEDYFTRVVFSDTVSLIGLAPENSDITVTVAGEEIDTAAIERTSNITFRADFNLGSLLRGQDYLVEVHFTDPETGKTVSESLYYPIKYATPVVEPQVSGIGTTYSLGETARATVVAGANDTLTVTDNGVGYFSAPLTEIAGTTQGQASFSLPTNIVGPRTITIQTTNAIGLSSSIQRFTYTVVDPAPVTPIETTETNEAIPENRDDDVQIENERDDLSDPDDRSRLKTRLNNLLRSTLVIEARRLTVDADGNTVEDDALEQNVNGDVVLRSQRTIGLRPSTWFDFGSTNSVDVLQFSGVSEPFATITLTIFSDPIIQVTEADDNGAWKMNVAVSDLPEGQHTAFLRSESRGVESDEVEIARFVVVQEQQLSNTSWILIANIIVALVIISIMITIRIQHYKEEKRMKTVRSKRTPITPEDLVTEIRSKQSEDDDDDDLHSALGV